VTDVEQIRLDPDPYEPFRLSQGFRVGDLVIVSGQAAIDDHGTFYLVLTGGSTPQLVCPLLVVPPRVLQLDWTRVEFFFGDERGVGPEHADSNYRMANQALLSKVPVPPAQIARIRGEATDPEAVAVLDRITAEVTNFVAGVIAEDPGAHRGEDDEERREHGVQVIAQLLVGAVQSLANWWADHDELPRQRIVEMTMDFAWLGLQRLTQGERWQTRAS